MKYYYCACQVKYPNGSIGFIRPEDIYSDDENIVKRMRVQARRGLVKYQKSQKTNDRI